MGEKSSEKMTSTLKQRQSQWRKGLNLVMDWQEEKEDDGIGRETRIGPRGETGEERKKEETGNKKRR